MGLAGEFGQLRKFRYWFLIDEGERPGGGWARGYRMNDA
jgi:hypothetical protein